MPAPPRVAASHDILVEARRVERSYEMGSAPVHALRGVDLDVAPGEFVAIVGVSGSGKSTLLQLIGALDTPTRGSVRVADRRIHELGERDRALYRRSMVGFVFQSFHLVPTLTALGNVQLALTLQGTYGNERRRLAEQALDRVGLAARRDHRPGQLSGGEQQRVAVARAIANRPRLLLADEPTGNLDRRNADEIVALLGDIRAAGTTVVMVTHDEALASSHADRLVRLRDGVVVDAAEQDPA